MKIDKARINRLIKHLNERKALFASLADGHSKDLVQMEIMTIEMSLMMLGIEVK